MNKINFNDLGTRYEIECEGGLIAFDMQEHDNIKRLQNMYDIFEKADKEYKASEILLAKKEDGKKNKYGMTAKEVEEMKAYDKYIKRCVEALDSFFGEGSSDIIFYDKVMRRPSVTMLKVEMLVLEILPQHFEKANLKAEDYMNERLKKRGKFTRSTEVVDLDEAE